MLSPRLRTGTMMLGLAIIALECGAIRASPLLGVFAGVVMLPAIAYTADAADRRRAQGGTVGVTWLVGKFVGFSANFAIFWFLAALLIAVFLWFLAVLVIAGPAVAFYFGR
jgi:hypothetical protein